MEAGGETDCGGDAAFGDFASNQNGGSGKADKGRETSGREREVEGFASLANTLVEDVLFDIFV